jgi:cytochrome c5
MRRSIVLLVVLAFAFTVAITGAFAERSGKQLYEATCAGCHGSGLLGAPKFGDKVWTDLLKKNGLDGFTQNAIAGKGAMPPMGGCGNCSEGEIRAAIEYMVDSAK